MESGLKQRLIGAAVLIVLALIFVPMLLDGPEREGDPTVMGIDAEPGRELDSTIVPLTLPLAPGAAIGVTQGQDPVATVDTNVAPRVDALSGERVDGSAAAPPTAPPARDPATDVAPPQTAVPAPATAPAPAPAPATSAPTPVPAPATSAPTAVPNLPGAQADGRFLLVFGSFTQAQNANALAADLRRGGIEARGEAADISGRAATRVVAGPFRDRASAERVRLSARQIRGDVSANVIEVAASSSTAPPSAAVTQAPSVGNAGWAVQIGAYQSATDAGAQRDRLRRGDFNAFIDQVRTERGTLYRVRVGPTGGREDAEALRTRLKSSLNLDGMVVQHP